MKSGLKKSGILVLSQVYLLMNNSCIEKEECVINTDTIGIGKSIDVETGTKTKRRRKRKKKKASKLSSSKDSKAETDELQVNACSSHTVDKSETTSIVTDPNELWVNYLWKTGSIIALDKYMDDMEKTLGNEILV